MTIANNFSLIADVEMTSIGRIVSVTGSKAVVLLDHQKYRDPEYAEYRPEMGTLIAIESETTISLGVVTALSVPMPGQSEDDPEVWIAELGLVGELRKEDGQIVGSFSRGISSYPALGDPVRVANHQELKSSFCDPTKSAVTVGTLRQDESIPATIKTDDLLGKHFAILGTTGTGKSCTTALILRAIIEENPAGHIVLLDPHNEYSTAFKEWAEVITPHNLQLPYWLLNFEEIAEVLIGNNEKYKVETELLQELIPMAKKRYGVNRKSGVSALKKNANDSGKYTVDTPVPYLISDVVAMIDERMGLLENKKDLSPYRHLRTKIETVIYDARYAFMFGNLTVNDNMADVLGRLFRVPVNGKPISILELTGLPTDVVAVVVSVICRLTFDFALWSRGTIPVTLVCEEAHRYVPQNSNNAFGPARRAIAKIAKEGRKYGASLCVVTQRPAEIDSTILSQCNTVFALRMANDRDQEIVQSAIADTGSGLLEFLPALGAREAIAFGDGVTLPVRIKFNKLDQSCLPRSSTAEFSEKWQTAVDDPDFLPTLVERWRTSGAVDLDESTVPQAPLPTPEVQTAGAAPDALTGAQDTPEAFHERRSVRRQPVDRAVAGTPQPSLRKPVPDHAVTGQPPVAQGEAPPPPLRRPNAETPEAAPSQTPSSQLRKPQPEAGEQPNSTLRRRAMDFATKPEKPVFK